MLTLADFQDKARQFAAELNAGDIIFLIGEMGAGKTTFVSALASYFEFDQVSSPSFALVNHYETKIPMLHIDLYRCKSEDEIKLLDLEYYFNKTDHIVLIEWAQKAPWLEAQCNKKVYISVNDDQTRTIKITT